ncbi:MAG: hypothetical protein Q9169_005110 [Polycauliona sp. 2 TL-2023]
MPPACNPPENSASVTPYLAARTADIQSNPALAATLEASETSYNGFMANGNNPMSCESNDVNVSSITAIIAIIGVVVVRCIAGFVKWNHSWDTTDAERDSPVMERRYPNRHSRGPNREQQEDDVRRHSYRQWGISARATTDLSGQQVQLQEHLDERRARNQRDQELQAPLDTIRLQTSEAAQRRDRERIWEQYQLRSNQDIIAGLEIAGSMDRQVPLRSGENNVSSIVGTRASLETLPRYTLEDPLKFHDQTAL